MEPTEANLKIVYHLLFIEAFDQHTTEWLGNLTLYPQANGETYIDFSFDDRPALPAPSGQPWDHAMPGFSIEISAQAARSETSHADQPGRYEQRIYHSIGLPITHINQ